MRRTLTALVLFSATLYILQSFPLKPRTEDTGIDIQSETMWEWVQTTVSDFERGELDRVTVTGVDDGEVILAKDEQGRYCGEGVFTSEVHHTGLLFNIIGAGWSVDMPSATTFRLEARASLDGETWSVWMDVSPDEDGPGSEQMTYGNLLEVSPSRYVQYRLIIGAFEPSVSPIVREVSLTMMNTREGPTVEEARAMILPQEATNGVPQPRIISRKGWGANEAWATREPVYRKPVAFVIHHTVTPNNPQDPAYIVRAILQYHALTRGWGDIGYNFLIDRQGNIYEGRKGGDGVVGVHAGDYNYGSIGIALLGDYRTAKMTPAMKEALVSLMAWQADRFGIHPLESSHFIHRVFPHIVGHRDLCPTVCPGDNVYRLLPELRQLTWERLLAHNPRVSIVSPDAGQAVSGRTVIEVSSPSPTTAGVQLFVDGDMKAEGESPLTWTWNTWQASEGLHRIKAVATSIQGRKSRVVSEVVVDNTPPAGSMLINDGASYTAQLTVTLSLQADDGEGQVVRMQFTQDEASEFTEPEDFLGTKEWVLSAEDGQKTVGARFLDWAGNASPVYTGSITLDTEPPGEWTLLQMDGHGEAVVNVADQGSGLDPSSGAYCTSTEGATTCDEWSSVDCDAEEGEGLVSTCTLAARFTGGTVRFRISDKAGNQGLSPIYGEAASPTPEENPTGTPAPTRQPTATPTCHLPPGTLPDLVVDTIDVTPGTTLESAPLTVTVNIENGAAAGVENGFWVELFVDPSRVPTVNSIAGQAGEGVFWYVPGLDGYETMGLSLDNADHRYTTFDGFLPSGRHELYAYVDAYNSEGEVGLVCEADESNNALGPVIVEIGRDSEQAHADARTILRRLAQELETFLARLREYLGSQQS